VRTDEGMVLEVRKDFLEETERLGKSERTSKEEYPDSAPGLMRTGRVWKRLTCEQSSRFGSLGDQTNEIHRVTMEGYLGFVQNRKKNRVMDGIWGNWKCHVKSDKGFGNL
jgi:hypothetical protein